MGRGLDGKRIFFEFFFGISAVIFHDFTVPLTPWSAATPTEYSRELLSL